MGWAPQRAARTLLFAAAAYSLVACPVADRHGSRWQRRRAACIAQGCRQTQHTRVSGSAAQACLAAGRGERMRGEGREQRGGSAGDKWAPRQDPGRLGVWQHNDVVRCHRIALKACRLVIISKQPCNARATKHCISAFAQKNRVATARRVSTLPAFYRASAGRLCGRSESRKHPCHSFCGWVVAAACGREDNGAFLAKAVSVFQEHRTRNSILQL